MTYNDVVGTIIDYVIKEFCSNSSIACIDFEDSQPFIYLASVNCSDECCEYVNESTKVSVSDLFDVSMLSGMEKSAIRVLRDQLVDCVNNIDKELLNA